MSEVFKDAIATLLAPISDLLKDSSVSEIMINGPSDIFIERKGQCIRVPNKFRDDESLMASMRAIAQSVGRVIDADNPRLDARLPDGSRIAVVIPPMARCGVTVAIRKFSEEKLTLKDLINFGSISPEAARFLDCCMYIGKNTLVSGGTGSGKTTMLNVLGGRMPKHQRLLIIEDSAELQIKADHVVRFETRKANPERGVKEVTIRDLVESALRLRPDRIIVGEIRGDESIELTPKEFAVLEYLMRHAGRVMSRTLITEYAWGYHFDPGTNIVDVVINHLRKKLGSTGPRIINEPGIGYRLESEGEG